MRAMILWWAAGCGGPVSADGVRSGSPCGGLRRSSATDAHVPDPSVPACGNTEADTDTDADEEESGGTGAAGDTATVPTADTADTAPSCGPSDLRARVEVRDATGPCGPCSGHLEGALVIDNPCADVVAFSTPTSCLSAEWVLTDPVGVVHLPPTCSGAATQWHVAPGATVEEVLDLGAPAPATYALSALWDAGPGQVVSSPPYVVQ